MQHSSLLPPLEALQAVISADATGSFSAAAAALDVTHGAISRRVAAVEAWAGCVVFVRHGRGVRLTYEGQQLVARIEQALALLDDGRGPGRRGPAVDVVRVGIVPSFARLWLLPNLAALEGRPQDLRVEPDIDHRFMSLSDARIAIRYGRGDWPGVSAVPLFGETLVPVASAAVAAGIAGAAGVGGGAEATAERLLEYPLINDTTDTVWRTWLSAAGIDYERRPRDRAFPDYDLTLMAAAQGLGIAILREPYGAPLCRALGLQPVSALRAESPLRFHVVTTRRPRHAAVDRLVARLLALRPACP
ncbi:LysR substrate-binding domain-containing protein [Arenibaculum sp.]|jgi:DNA-binding transcriptional LysR family regulator|uniref:LysR substrate-binding domain-containing protein n=1 Tax=Arenibaculum sp. TaxID=2865862 RepID=UPI002E154A73|nr:LysR substrate-binding domain-containing protein [Arenibaculum sp.]